MKRTGGFFKGVFDGFRSSGSQPAKEKTEPAVQAAAGMGPEPAPEPEWEIQENLRVEHFKVAKTVRHGFPHQPTAVAFDPVQRLLAIGTKTGSLRIFGRPGVEYHVELPGESPILQLIFIINQGTLISMCGDDSIYMWDLKPQKQPEITHTVRFQKERVRYCHLPFQSKWLYVGTEKGNIHVVNVESFVLSGYVIHWNKAIELSCRNHPGPVIHLSDNPLDSNKLLIGYTSGLVVMWDLRNRAADVRFHSTEPVRSIAWHIDGRQFMCSHSDGSLSTWNIRSPAKPLSFIYPHSKVSVDGKLEPCKAIYKVDWKINRTGESLIIFSGGLPYEETGRSPSLTIQQGKATTVLEMDFNITDFVTLCETPWQTDYQEPYAIVVLLEKDLVLVDLTSPGYPCFQNPYPMDFHKSPVTSCTYIADCPNDLIPVLYSVGCMGSRQAGCSDKEWPITGGEWSSSTTSYPEIVITGHADGTLQFWDASSLSFQVLYKLKTSKAFERPKSRSFDEQEDDPLAIDQIAFCGESRILCVAGMSSHVIVYNFSRTEVTTVIPVLEIPIKYESEDSSEITIECDQQIFNFQQESIPNTSEENSDKLCIGNHSSLKVRTNPVKMQPGFQICLVCLTPTIGNETPGRMTILCVNSSYGLLAYGTDYGLAIVDIQQKTCLLNMGTPDLYGSADPYRRLPMSPRRASSGTSGNVSNELEHCQSPVPPETDDPCLSPTLKHPPYPKKMLAPEGKTPECPDKGENTFPHSRSSSVSSLSSLKTVPIESVLCLRFAESYGGKTESTPSPSLWVGTSLGSVLVFLLILPPAGEARQVQPVIISPSGTMYRLKGSVISISFLDATGAILLNNHDAWKDESRGKEEKKMRLSSKSTHGNERREKQVVVLVSEKEAQVISLPTQMVGFRTTLTNTSCIVRAEVSFMKELGSSCLACCLGSGHIKIFSLPSLKPLLTTEFLPVVGVRILKTFYFSNNGHGIYFSSPSEVQKFTISASFCVYLQEMLGNLFMVRDMPEPPKQGFFKGLFGGGPSVLDREELFGETSGKCAKGVARTFQGSSIDHVKCQSSSLAGELSRARQGLTERGEALTKLEERTARMMTEAENYAKTSHELLLKYRDKKWYQL